VSLHYEWVLSLRLRPDVPKPFIDELRFHLGISDHRPEATTLDYDWPCLLPDNNDAVPGGGIQTLVIQQPYLDRPESLGLFVRTFVLDDGMYELIQTVPAWLAPWSLTQGWIGYAREELSLQPWLNFYTANGYAYAAEPGGPIGPLTPNTPEFTLEHTSDLPDPGDGRGPGLVARRKI
jgi:hypothetical protein